MTENIFQKRLQEAIKSSGLTQSEVSKRSPQDSMPGIYALGICLPINTERTN